MLRDPGRCFRGHAGRGDQPGCVPSGTRSQLVTLQHQYVRPARLGEVKGGREADDAAPTTMTQNGTEGAQTQCISEDKDAWYI